MDDQPEATIDELFEELQKAAERHQAILARQFELIKRLRQDLKEVPR